MDRRNEDTALLALRGGLRGRFRRSFDSMENAFEVLQDRLQHAVNPAERAELMPLLEELQTQLICLRRLGDQASDAATAALLHGTCVPQPIDLLGQLREFCSILQEEAAQYALPFTVTLQADGLDVLPTTGDVSLLNGLLTNLVSNTLAADRAAHIMLHCTPGRETNTVQVTFPATELAPMRNFLFDRAWVIDQAKYFNGAVSQLYVSAILPTRYGDVELYGFIDELKRDVVYDIKTTSSYSFGKYEHGWQRHVYPYCLIASGEMQSVSAFEYTAFALKGGTSRTPLISGTRYPEYYTYNHEQTVKQLTQHVERFIEFLEANRNLITDKKIFAEE